MSKQSSRIVVTGASGFIGNKVIELLQENRDINLIPVTRKKFGNWTRVTDYAESPPGDVLIHLAENGNRSEVAKFDSSYENAIQSTLKSLLKKRFHRVVYISSGTLYGDKDDRPHHTTDEIVIPDAYTRIKRQSELAVLNSPGGIVVRLANIYGSGMSESNVMSTILNQIPGDGAVKIFDASPVRDFLNVKDAAEGIMALALCRLNERNEGIYNLGSGLGTSIGSLAREALDLSGQSKRQIHSEKQTSLQSCLILDYSTTTDYCGWNPRISLHQGLGDLLQNRKIRTS